VLEHVFENLATNAIKYGPKNSAVWVSFHVTPEFGHIRIRDEGPGFSPADMKRLFERYVKLSASPTGNEISTGLGLSIAKRLANQHGGRLELISQPRESAEFEVTFGVV
jgi:signal transduction histidine kinase